jgi:hypothetical protein
MLAELQLNYILSKPSETEMLRALQSLPQNSLYDEIMDQLKATPPSRSKDRAFHTLSWIFYAERPLQMEELQELLSVEEGQREPCTDENNSPEAIIHACNGLVWHDKITEVVGFSDIAVRELLRRPEYAVPAHYTAKTCLQYLGSSVFMHVCESSTALNERFEKYKAISYVVKSWEKHTASGKDSPDVLETFISLVKSENRRNSILQMEGYVESEFANMSFTSGLTVLHLIAKIGLAALFEPPLNTQINDIRYRSQFI